MDESKGNISEDDRFGYGLFQATFRAAKANGVGDHAAAVGLIELLVGISNKVHL